MVRTSYAAPSALDFDGLRGLQESLERILSRAVVSLQHYAADDYGYRHRLLSLRTGDPARKGGWSRASTATCLALLDDTGEWNHALRQRGGSEPSETVTEVMVRQIIDGEPGDSVPKKGAWTSAELLDDNPFTVSFLLSALGHLHSLGAQLDDTQKEVVAAKAGLLLRAMLGIADAEADPVEAARAATVGVRINPFPATSFLTYKAIKGLNAASDLLDDAAQVFPTAARILVNEFGWRAMRAELVALDAEQPDADPFELAYALLVVLRTTTLADMAPADRGILKHALAVFFSHQTKAGTWPRSRPLFMYPDVGNAYCFDYELLADMLGEAQLRAMLLDHLPRLGFAATALDEAKYPLLAIPDEHLDAGYAWASGHHRQDPSPESWATASAFHFVSGLLRLVAEAIRIEVFAYVGDRYDPEDLTAPGARAAVSLDVSHFADSVFEDNNGGRRQLVETINAAFLRPIAADEPRIERGQPLSDDTTISAIIYGPPGTSKTTLAKLVAKALGWPLLSLDPSHLTRRGLDRLHEESNRIFGMLASLERVVVLMDEFDELVRERGADSSEFVSRFLTTSMLPKLAALHERRRIVWIVATNHIEIFDSAIRRPGRFDMIVPLMPPTLADKREKIGVVDVPTGDRQQADEMLEDLTWGEYKSLFADVKQSSADAAAVLRLVEAAHEACTLQQPADGRTPPRPNAPSATGNADVRARAKTWKVTLEEARTLIRIP